MPQVLTGTYRTREGAVRAAERLLEAGFTRDEVCLLAPDDRHGNYFAVRPVSSTLPGFGGGAMIGLILGALAAVGYAFVGMPVQGLELLEGQPLLVLALCGAGAGALAGGVLGALMAIAYSFVELPIQGLELLEGQPLLVLGLMGAGAGAVAGGLLGALVGAFRTHHETVIESDHHHAVGYMLVGVTAPRNMARSAAELLQISGASKVTRS